MNLNKLKNPFFIAELSANHNGSLKNAKKLIDHAKKYGADAVKLQTYTPDTMTLNSKKKDFLIKDGLWKGYNLWSLFDKGKTPYAWHKILFDYAKKKKIQCFSTPFSEEAVDFLEELNCPFYKVAFFEMTALPLIKKIAETKKKIIISTGMANLREIDKSFNLAKKYGAKEIILLYCVSNYPAKNSDFNLNNIYLLKDRYKCTIGFSDHSNNFQLAEAAVAAGAEVFEKHIYLNNVKSLDYKFSLKGKEIKKYRDALNNTNLLMGKKYFYRTFNEKKNRILRRSIYATKDIKKRELLTKENIRIIRPGYGLDPVYFEQLIDKNSPIDIKKETPLRKSILVKLKIKKIK